VGERPSIIEEAAEEVSVEVDGQLGGEEEGEGHVGVL
jgi:hypothetical protein